MQSFEYFFHSFKIYLNNIYLIINGALFNVQNVHIHIYIYSSISQHFQTSLLTLSFYNASK